MFTKYATRQPRLDFRRRLVFQQPADFPVNAGNPLRDLLQRTADIAQAQQMLRAAIQAEHRSRHELDTLQVQPLPEQNSVHIRPIRQQRDGHYPRTGGWKQCSATE